MSFQGLDWDLLTPVRSDYRVMDELDRIIYVDKLTVEMDTGSNDVTPRLNFLNTNDTFTAINTSQREYTQVDIDRLGPVTRFRLEYNEFDEVKLYSPPELFIRPLDLGLNIPNVQGRRLIRGRSVDPTTSLTWRIQPHDLSPDARIQNPLIKYLYVDIVTGAETVTPVLEFKDGTTSSLAGITEASRTTVEYSIGNTQEVSRLRLDGDFTSSDIIVYDVEIDIYISRSQLI